MNVPLRFVYVLQALGSLAFQPLHQRILSAESSNTAKLSCFAAAVVFFIFAIPAAIIGGMATTAGNCMFYTWQMCM